MTKTLKGLSAILMTSVLAVSASAATVGSMTAWASTNTITINLPTNDKATHTYEAYQVFKGDLSSGVLSNITWGDHVDQSPLLAALAADTAFQITNTDAAAITTTSSAADVAQYLSVHNDATAAKKFADHVTASLNSTAAITGSFTAATTSTAASAVIDVTTPGYYLVKDKDNSLATTDANGAYTKFILKVVGPETVTAKEDVPSITTKIVQGSREVPANTASIGDVLPYVLHSSVPDMTNFDSFCYVINDTMEAGLTFNDDVLASSVRADQFTVTRTADGDTAKKQNIASVSVSGKTITINFTNAITDNTQATYEVIIKSVTSDDVTYSVVSTKGAGLDKTTISSINGSLY